MHSEAFGSFVTFLRFSFPLPLPSAPFVPCCVSKLLPTSLSIYCGRRIMLCQPLHHPLDYTLFFYICIAFRKNLMIRRGCTFQPDPKSQQYRLFVNYYRRECSKYFFTSTHWLFIVSVASLLVQKKHFLME